MCPPDRRKQEMHTRAHATALVANTTSGRIFFPLQLSKDLFASTYNLVGVGTHCHNESNRLFLQVFEHVSKTLWHGWQHFGGGGRYDKVGSVIK